MYNYGLLLDQAVEFFGEWALCPQNVAFLRVQTSVFDPLLIGDKAKWFANQLQPIYFNVYEETSTLGAALSSASEIVSDEFPTGEMYSHVYRSILCVPPFMWSAIMDITPDLLYLNMHNPFTNERISVYLDKHSRMSLDTKNYFVKQISHMSKGMVIVALV